MRARSSRCECVRSGLACSVKSLYERSACRSVTVYMLLAYLELESFICKDCEATQCTYCQRAHAMKALVVLLVDFAADVESWIRKQTLWSTIIFFAFVVCSCESWSHLTLYILTAEQGFSSPMVVQHAALWPTTLLSKPQNPWRHLPHPAWSVVIRVLMAVLGCRACLWS